MSVLGAASGLALAALLATAGPAAAQDPAGVWWTQDKDGVVAIRHCGAGLCGSIEGVTSTRPDGSIPLDFRGRSRCHLQIIPDGTLRSDGVWASHITNPDDGKTYTTELSLDPGGRLRMRGYIGLPLFGRTVYWTPFTGKLTRDCRITN